MPLLVAPFFHAFSDCVSFSMQGVASIMAAVDGSRGVRVLYCLEDISFANNFAGPEGAACIGIYCLQCHGLIDRLSVASDIL
jgi:hypothetical protein